MNNTINSINTFKGRLSTDIVLKNAKYATRFENIAKEYEKATADVPGKDLFLSHYRTDDNDIILKIFGKDTFISESLEKYLDTMSDSEIVTKLSKIADYLPLKHQKNKANYRYINRIIDIEGKIKTNEEKSKALFASGNEKFGKLFAKVADLNKKTLKKIQNERVAYWAKMDAKIQKIADGDAEIIDDMLIF